jgi:hypothetical protein
VSVIDWLLDSDPSIRWQVMRDLIGAPTGQVAAERARVANTGVGAHLLALQSHDGQWGGAAWNRGWDSTMHALLLLRDLGLDPASDQARRAVGLVRDRVTWKGCGPQECHRNTFFEGEVEPCINGQVAVVGAYFGQEVRNIRSRCTRARADRADGIPCAPCACFAGIIAQIRKRGAVPTTPSERHIL